jgi:membrane protein DedA with SNARE-associated domain
MIWLSIVSLAVGGLLARHFKIIILVPATVVIAAIAIAAGELQTTGIWSIVFAVVIVSVGMQIGYFLGLLTQHALNTLLAGRASPSSDKRTERPSWISRTPISR